MKGLPTIKEWELDEVRVVQCNVGLTMGQLLRAFRDIECKFNSAHIPLRINGKSVNKIDINICTDSEGSKYVDISI